MYGERANAPRQLSDFGSFGLIVGRGEISQVAKVLHDALGKGRAEGTEFVLGDVFLAPCHQVFIVARRKMSIEFAIQVRVRLLPIRRQALKVELDQLGDPAAILEPDAVDDDRQERVEDRSRRHLDKDSLTGTKEVGSFVVAQGIRKDKAPGVKQGWIICRPSFRKCLKGLVTLVHEFRGSKDVNCHVLGHLSIAVRRQML